MGKDVLVQQLVDSFDSWPAKNSGCGSSRMTQELYPFDKLFSPIKINKLTVKNRIVMAPMGNIDMCEETGRPSDMMLQYFFARAKGGCGLITTGIVPVSHGIDTTVTVSDLKRMNDYGLCILSAHGSYYTYTSGFLFKQTRTEPVILLTEESDFYKDLYYGIDLLTHRVIKINGLYCITPSFFRAAYRGGQLKDTVVLSETCEFLGVSGSLDTSMADALLAGGAKAVAGYVNNVYTVYSRSMLWDTVNHLILGQTLQESVQHSMDTYGADDLVWYNAQGGKRPHAAAAYPLLFGDVGVRLIEPNAAPAPQEVQQAA